MRFIEKREGEEIHGEVEASDIHRSSCCHKTASECVRRQTSVYADLHFDFVCVVVYLDLVCVSQCSYFHCSGALRFQ